MRLKVSNVCQLLDKSKYPATQTKQGVTYTNDGNGIITLNGTNTASYLCVFILNARKGKPGHKYMQLGATDDGFWNRYGLELKWVDGDGVGHGFTMTNGIMSIPSDAIVRDIYVSALVYQGYTVSNKTFKPQLFDLTEMYGAGNEPTTVAQFRQDFPNEMYEYSPVCWEKFRRLKYVTETKNLFDVNNAVPYTFSTDNPDGNLIWLKDGIYTTRMNNYNIGSGLRIKNGWKLPAGVYTLSVKVVDCADFGTGGYANIGFYYKIADGTWHVLNSPKYSYAPGTTLSLAINIPEHIELRLYLNYQNMNGKYLTGFVSYKDIQLEQGSTATPYQPYGYLPLNRGKYIANKEPVQLLDKTKYRGTATKEGITFTNNGDGTWTVVGTAPDDPINHSYVAYSILFFSKEFTQKYFIPGHKIVVGGGKVNYDAFVQWILSWTGGYLASNSSANYTYTITEYPENFGVNSIELRVSKGKTVNFTFKPQFFDLTEMYGAGNEPTTVAQFKADFPNELYDYNPYNAITFR